MHAENISRSEEDTFNRLRRTPAKEMFCILLRNSCSKSANTPVLIQHGWTRDEFDKEISHLGIPEILDIYIKVNNE